MKKLLTIAILITSVHLSIAQPIIGLGMSKHFIENHMHNSPDWRCVSKQPDQLIYTDGYTVFTYKFVRDVPGRLNKTCTSCIAEFVTADELYRYINRKITDSRLKPDPDNLNLILITDLYNDTIRAVAVGKRIIFSY